MKLAALASIVILPSLTALAAVQPAAPLNFRLLRFVAPNGSAANDGTTTNSPWSLSYAMAQAGPATVINLLPGTYPSIEISQPGTKLASQTKWAAKVVGSPGAHGIWTDTNVGNVTIDGIEVANSALDGINLNGSNCVVRNCWVHDSTVNGVSARLNSNTLVERNLIERNGTAAARGHGINLSGTNCVVRANVLRDNPGWGCQIYAAPPYSSAECDFYNNLVYRNGGGLTVWSPVGQTNYVFNNTILTPSNNCLIADYGNLFVSNNIFVVGGGHPVMAAADGATVRSDYNLANASTSPGGPHDVVASDPGFVNTNAGLYWLTSSSAARGGANPAVIPPFDFFGKAEFTMNDVGAVQYGSAMATDTRVLDPSTSNGADYWVPFSSSGTPPGITTPPQSQTVIAGQSAAFTVAAIGDAPLSFQWIFNGVIVGSSSSAYSRANCQLADNGGQVQVKVSNGSGSVQSSIATLTVGSSGTPPSITTQPQNQTVSAGQSAVFTVAATGDAPLSFQWTFNGLSLGSTSSAYSRANCQLGDNGGLIQVTVSNASGSVQSSSATLTVNPSGAVYYVATNGSSGNNGLTASTPWNIATGAYALTNGNTIIVMPGVYTAPVWIHQGSGPGTFKSQYKWKAVIANSATQPGICFYYPTYTTNVTIDGFCISNVFQDGISADVNSCTFQNNWIYNAANGSEPHDGINCSGGSNNIIQYNLVEYTHALFGAIDHSGHGLYVSGSSNIVRGNVLRYNGGYGFQHYTGLTTDWINGNKIYNNLTYGNTNNYGCAVWGAYGNDGTVNPGTNEVFSNTFIDGLQVRFGEVHLTNNIILGRYQHAGTPLLVVKADYNLGTSATTGGAHDVVTTMANLGFVNAANGLFWLSASSTARGAALSAVFGPVDFFGNSESSVSDIGALQYSALAAEDTRVLDPSPANPDYWSTP